MPNLRIRFRGVQTLVPGGKIDLQDTTSVDAMCFLLPNASFDDDTIRCHQAYLETPDAQRNPASFVTRVALDRRRVHFEVDGVTRNDGVGFDKLDATIPPDPRSESLAWLPRMDVISPGHEVSKKALAIRPDNRVTAQVVLTTGRLSVDLGDVSGRSLEVTTGYEQQFANAVTWEVRDVEKDITAVLTSLDDPDAAPVRVKLATFGREGDIHVSVGNTCDVEDDPRRTAPQVDEDFELHYALLEKVKERLLPTLATEHSANPIRRAEDRDVAMRASARRPIPGITPWFCFGALTTNANLTELAKPTAAKHQSA